MAPTRYPRLCDECGRRIPKARIEALPETTVCVRCSHETPKTVDDVEIDAVDGGTTITVNDEP